ncbi:MAG: hypothetical protein ACE5JI_21990, partial [Acidobacteriota bacterium]
KQSGRMATGYRWRFYHYGPWAVEAQRDIDDCVGKLIKAETRPGSEDMGEVTLYLAGGPEPNFSAQFTASLDVALRHEINRWIRAPLNQFLDYVYFDTPPMREAKRGDYLRFDPQVFATLDPQSDAPARRHSSREARQAFRRFLESRKGDPRRVPVPRDAIVDDAYLTALEALDAEDRLAGPLEGSVEADPDALA